MFEEDLSSFIRFLTRNLGYRIVDGLEMCVFRIIRICMVWSIFILITTFPNVLVGKYLYLVLQ